MSINKFFVAGHVGKDPESYTIETGERAGEIIASFSLAERIGKDKDGNNIVAWHQVTVGGKKVDVVMGHVKKGAKLVVEGRASANAYMSKDQKIVSQIKIWLTDFEFASDKDDDIPSELESNTMEAQPPVAQ